MQDPANTVQINGVYQSFNANYNSSSGLWDVTMTAPSDTSKTYKIMASFYCSDSSAGCSSGQIEKSFNFVVVRPSITISSNPQSDANSNVTIQQGTSISITGIPKNLSGTIGTDYSIAFFFDPIFDGACTTDGLTITCSANQVGTSNFYIELLQGGQKYNSNIIKVNVVAATTLSATLSCNGSCSGRVPSTSDRIATLSIGVGGGESVKITELGFDLAVYPTTLNSPIPGALQLKTLGGTLVGTAISSTGHFVFSDLNLPISPSAYQLDLIADTTVLKGSGAGSNTALQISMVYPFYGIGETSKKTITSQGPQPHITATYSGLASLNDIEKQLADISAAMDALIKELQKLLGI
jgi:hypothetical protein